MSEIIQEENTEASFSVLMLLVLHTEMMNTDSEQNKIHVVFLLPQRFHTLEPKMARF